MSWWEFQYKTYLLYLQLEAIEMTCTHFLLYWEARSNSSYNDLKSKNKSNLLKETEEWPRSIYNFWYNSQVMGEGRPPWCCEYSSVENGSGQLLCILVTDSCYLVGWFSSFQREEIPNHFRHVYKGHKTMMGHFFFLGWLAHISRGVNVLILGYVGWFLYKLI